MTILKAFFGSVAAVIGLVGTFVIMIVAIAVVFASQVDLDEQLTTKKLSPSFVAGDVSSNNKLLEIPISGIILGERQESDFFQALGGYDLTYGYDIKEQLKQASEMEDIKGVLLNIQSPGGTIFGTKAITDGITQYRQATSKPVVAYVGSIAASGGYWVASSADQIVADLGTTLGSIGVIAGPFKYYDQVTSEDGGAFMGGVVTQGGVETTYITAGSSKDLGNPYRRLTTREISTLQTGVNNAYEYFVTDVGKSRYLDPEFIKDEVGALIYDEQQAKELHLIDKVGSKQDAEQELANLAVLKDDYQVVRDSGSNSLFGDLGVMMSRSFGNPSLNSSSNSGACVLATLPLAYHGDVSVLCR